ncbi:MAG: pseudouridine synthase [Lysobacterales bacterium]
MRGSCTLPPARRRARSAATPNVPRHGLARVISKRGIASRTQATQWIVAGRVTLDGHVVRDPETPTDIAHARIALDGVDLGAGERVYLMLNKPRGFVTSAADERGRDTVYALLADAGLPWLAPVGRLDKASEGLLLFSNDSVWAARITAPESHLDKTYHVQIDRRPDAVLLAALHKGIGDHGERLAVKSARELRRGDKNAWLEIVLDEGRNRQIRRILAAFDVGVLRLVRIAIGGLALGTLEKGTWRKLDSAEVAALASLSIRS